MSATPGQAAPFQQPQSSVTHEQALLFLIRQRLRDVQTAILVEVQAVNGGGVSALGTVDVLPLVDQVDGAGNAVPHVTIYGRPFARIQGGKNAVILDPQVGDLGLMVFCSRDISSVLASTDSGPPPTNRIFSYADGFYVGGYPNAANGAPERYVQVTDTEINMVAPELNITTSGNVNINGAIISSAGEVTDAAGKVLGTHVHSGVQTGGGDTGPPV